MHKISCVEDTSRSQAAQTKMRWDGAQGTASSKKKKQAKLKRVMHTVKKQARRERADGAEGFAAIQLLHDPQVLQARFGGLHGLGSNQGIDMFADHKLSSFWSCVCKLL